MTKMRVIVVGGFLGAGKTTLLAQAAKHLAADGKSVAIITNDQAAQLVDTQVLESLKVAVREVAGGCFCCRFEDLENTASRIFRDGCPDILLTEPVGSCTDISATVLQPMKKFWGGWAHISPFSVLADPRRLKKALDAESSPTDCVRYIVKKQFEEADCIVINKTDLISPDELAKLKDQIASTWSGASVFEMSALQDWGVTEWLNAVLSTYGGGNRILDIDYDIYARGEAELGWLNTSVRLCSHGQTNWEIFALDLIRKIQKELEIRAAEIGHLKLLISNPTGRIVANVTSISEGPTIQGGIGTHADPINLVINARARVEPEQLKEIIERSIRNVAGETVEISGLNLNSFSPAYPRPTHRIDRVIQP